LAPDLSVLRLGTHAFALHRGVVIGFAGAILFLVVDKFERDSPMANLLKFLILVVGGVAILHKLQPLLGIALF
jgi:hypothetical protein